MSTSFSSFALCSVSFLHCVHLHHYLFQLCEPVSSIVTFWLIFQVLFLHLSSMTLIYLLLITYYILPFDAFVSLMVMSCLCKCCFACHSFCWFYGWYLVHAPLQPWMIDLSLIQAIYLFCCWIWLIVVLGCMFWPWSAWSSSDSFLLPSANMSSSPPSSLATKPLESGGSPTCSLMSCLPSHPASHAETPLADDLAASSPWPSRAFCLLPCWVSWHLPPSPLVLWSLCVSCFALALVCALGIA